MMEKKLDTDFHGLTLVFAFICENLCLSVSCFDYRLLNTIYLRRSLGNALGYDLSHVCLKVSLPAGF